MSSVSSYFTHASVYQCTWLACIIINLLLLLIFVYKIIRTVNNGCFTNSSRELWYHHKHEWKPRHISMFTVFKLDSFKMLVKVHHKASELLPIWHDICQHICNDIKWPDWMLLDIYIKFLNYIILMYSLNLNLSVVLNASCINIKMFECLPV